jgi:amino acid transporter
MPPKKSDHPNTAMIGSYVLLGFQAWHFDPIAIGIAILIAIVTISYRQTIFSNPAGGGGYRVAKENLGEALAQVTGAALLTDYILTVAVSISAGVANVISVVPALLPFRVWLTIGVIVFMTFINLRGVKESARLFSIPTYFFLATIGITLVLGFYKLLTGDLNPVVGVEAIEHNVLGPITLLLLLAPSSGCTADRHRGHLQRYSSSAAALKRRQYTGRRRHPITRTSITVLANAVQAVPSHTETVISCGPFDL